MAEADADVVAASDPPMSTHRQKLYDEKKCFRCEKSGHTVAGCPVPPTPKQQQGNAKADK